MSPPPIRQIFTGFFPSNIEDITIPPIHIASPSAVKEAAPARLVDRFGRIARDLRISLTDRCNLRCSCCTPPEGLEWLLIEDTLNDEEVARLARIEVELLGIHDLHFTGSESLLRRGLEDIIAQCVMLTTDEGRRPDIALATGALGLDKRAHSLAKAGLGRVNVSLDILDPQHYVQITRRDRLRNILTGPDAAAKAGLRPIKVNAVVLRGINDADLPDLPDFCLDRGIELRVIEQIPIGPPSTWGRQKILTRDDILHLLSARHILSPLDRVDLYSPTRSWSVNGDPQRLVSIIASVSEPFCQTYDRTRLTSDGMIHSCLFSTEEKDLRTLLCSGATGEQIDEARCEAMWVKPFAHGLDTDAFATPPRAMSAIGG